MLLRMTTLVLLLVSVTVSAQDVESELQEIANEFPSAVASEAELEALKDRADELDDRIRADRRSHRSSLSDDEMSQSKELEDKAEALSDVFQVVGQLTHSGHIELEDFNLVRDMLKLEWHVVETLDTGVEIVRIDVGAFHSILFHNPGPDTYTTTYLWDADGLEQRGTGARNIRCKSLSGILNSRDYKTDNIVFSKVHLTKNPYVDAC